MPRIVDSELPPLFFGKFFCLIPKTNTAFIVIAKNANTFLKKVAFWHMNDIWLKSVYDPHTLIGYDESSEFLIPIHEMSNYEKKHGSLMKFAIWRDPLDRVVSTYKLFCMEKRYRRYFHFIGLYEDTSFDRFMNFLEFEWNKPNPLIQDPHIRRQSDYYQTCDVDYIVPMSKLFCFLDNMNIPYIREQTNRTTVSFTIDSVEYLEKIRDFYFDDYNIPTNY